MADLTTALLEEVAGDTLEQAAFVFVEPTDEQWPPECELLEAVISLRGPSNGTLVLSTSSAFATALAANLLGIDEEDDDAVEQGSAALAEILNIMGGILLSKACDEADSCGLGIPTVKTTTAASHDEVQERAMCKVALLADDEHRLDVAVFVERVEGGS